MSNCLLWALSMRLRFGGEIRYRQSLMGWFPHFYWITPDGRDAYEFVPDDPARRKWPQILFHGHVRRY